jgi:aryl-alcohol dehydrogenase-like predicted oxidoreductase
MLVRDAQAAFPFRCSLHEEDVVSENGGSIVERLQSQKANLLNVVEQIDVALRVFAPLAGTPTNGNGIQAQPNGKGSGSGSWWKTLTPQQRSKEMKRRLAIGKRRKRAAAKRAEAEAGAAAKVLADEPQPAWMPTT